LEKKMTKANLERYRQALEKKRNELLTGSSDREDILIENAAEDFDRLQQQLNREVAIRNLDRESTMLKNVQAALARFDNDTFGVCLRCDEDIPEKRLNALPWAAYCVKCQEVVDRQRAMGEIEDDDTVEIAA
jgi:RNA polymerase-binding transcription factor